jgi:MFS family permease
MDLSQKFNLLVQTIVTTALPSIIADFDASESDYTWVGSSYMLAAAGMLAAITRDKITWLTLLVATTPSWGKISDIFGRKPILLTANVIFFAGSLVCALSVNVHMLLGGRVLQGIGSGGLLTLAAVCIADMFSVR